MIKRRGFFGRFAALFGLSAIPVHASEEAAEQRIRREMMAAKGFGPYDVQVILEWESIPNYPGMLCLRMVINCNGDTYGQVQAVNCGVIPRTTRILITPTDVKDIRTSDVRRSD